MIPIAAAASEAVLLVPVCGSAVGFAAGLAGAPVAVADRATAAAGTDFGYTGPGLCTLPYIVLHPVLHRQCWK